MPAPHRTARRTVTVTIAVLGALMLALSPTAAHAAGWGTALSKTYPSAHKLALDRTYVFPTTASGFRTAKNVTYRICVTVSGHGKASLGPSNFATTFTIGTDQWVTKCGKSYAGPATTLRPEITLKSGAMKVHRMTIQRWYTGSVPV